MCCLKRAAVNAANDDPRPHSMAGEPGAILCRSAQRFFDQRISLLDRADYLRSASRNGRVIVSAMAVTRSRLVSVAPERCLAKRWRAQNRGICRADSSPVVLDFASRVARLESEFSGDLRRHPDQ